MPSDTKILAIDQGTTSTRAIVFDGEARPVASAQLELEQHFPRPGWVEHDPFEIAEAAVTVSRQAVASAGLTLTDITAIGIANQRETTVVWERETGRPVANAIVWQCRRTAEMCNQLIEGGHADDIWDRTGLVVDAYFSATKLRWLLDHIEYGQRRAEDGELCFGTVDSWLVFRLTGGSVHATDATNASRTMLLNLHDLEWDPVLLDLFDVPYDMLPEVMPSASDFGETDGDVLGAEIPITGVAGDQHAALYGQACFEPGMTKCSYGTGAFVLANTGATVHKAAGGLVSTLGWQVGAKRAYALEGSIFVTGATVQWLRDGLGIIEDAAETAELAIMAGDNDGVYLVPAFVGLGAPYWDARARGAIFGLTLDTGRAEIARAALEAVAYQTRDLMEAMAADGADAPVALRVDGGMVVNDWTMQFLADILDVPVERPTVTETTALGAACLAGLRTGFYPSLEAIAAQWRCERVFVPAMERDESDRRYAGWRAAVDRVLSR